MKMFLFAFATALSVLSTGSLAAGLATNAGYDGQPQSIRFSGASARATLPSLSQQGEKVVPDNTRSYPMTSVSGRKNLHNTSIVYE